MANKYYISDENVNVARGLIVGTTWLHRLGEIPTMPNGTETVIMSGGITSGRYVFPSAAGTLSIVSSSASDNSGKTILVSGLDANYSPITETVVMNGTTPVVTTQQFLRVQRISTSGATSIVGNVSATHGSNIVAHLHGVDAQSLQCVYTIPKGVTGYLKQISASVPKGGDAIFKLNSKAQGVAYTTTRHIFGLASQSYTYDFMYPTLLPEKTDIEMTCLSSTGGSSASGTFDILLVNNAPFN